jgi:putative ABC transport system permease protein
MLLLEITLVALSSLRANLMRSILTMLGVIIGVAAVITMGALGSGAQAAVESQIAGLGANTLTVRAGSGFWGGGSRDRGARMEIDDAYAIIEKTTSIGAVVPVLDRSGVQVEYENKAGTISVTGTWIGYLEANGFKVDRGRFFTGIEQDGNRRVAVIGSETATNLFDSNVDPIGEQIRISGVVFEIIGILQEKGSMGPFSRDNVAVIPLSTAMRRLFGTDYLSSISVEALSDQHVTMAMAEIESVLRRQHRLRPGTDNDFSITRATEFLNVIAGAQQSFTFLLAGIAAISLIVGGIGIMNIMLVSVTERTREIGIRRAIGARRSAIQLQFLIEAVALSCLGGAMGIALGYMASDQLAARAGWQMMVTGDTVGMAVGFSAMVGVVFGFYPARRASKLDPIDALRYD